MIRAEVLIAGAGPTGLTLALWLTRQGVDVKILDKAAGPGTTSRALAVQARTLELYQQLGLTDAVLAQGRRAPAMNLWVQGQHKARVPLGALGEGVTPYPYLLTYPQDVHEELLVQRLEALGVPVQWQTELVELTDHGGQVRGRARGPQGDELPCEAAYVAGCDGAHSTVRHDAGIEFPGSAYPKLFYVADIQGSGPAVNGEAHVALDEADLIAILPMPGAGHARLVGLVSEQRLERGKTPSIKDVSPRVIASMQLRIDTVRWFSTYRVHHRVAGHFRQGRALLAGDAGHIHSPVGGQGMNTGIGDAINLAWKLATVLRKDAGDWLLDTYEAERIAFARQLVHTTDRMFTFVTASGYLADFVRTRLVPLLVPAAAQLPGVAPFLFRTVSQTLLNYRHGALAQGKAGSVHGGDRLPWAGPGEDNFGSLAALTWQVHVYGTAGGELAAWCRSRSLALHIFPWSRAHQKAGLKRDAAYLLRPDTYVALADPSGSPEELERYFSTRGIRLARTSEPAA